jgi:hypothetical protein
MSKAIIIEQKKAMSLICQRCSHSWDYTGKNPYVATCPFCRTNVSVKKQMRLQQQKKQVEKRTGVQPTSQSTTAAVVAREAKTTQDDDFR